MTVQFCQHSYSLRTLAKLAENVHHEPVQKLKFCAFFCQNFLNSNFDARAFPDLPPPPSTFPIGVYPPPTPRISDPFFHILYSYFTCIVLLIELASSTTLNNRCRHYIGIEIYVLSVYFIYLSYS